MSSENKNQAESGETSEDPSAATLELESMASLLNQEPRHREIFDFYGKYLNREEVPAFYHQLAPYRLDDDSPFSPLIPREDDEFFQELEKHRELTDPKSEEGAIFLKLLQAYEKQRRFYIQKRQHLDISKSFN